MKISKLFHWLYAFLMLLPIAFLVPNIFYYAFNDNATNSHIEQTTINYKYETNEVNSLDDLVDGNVYEMLIYENVSPSELILDYGRNSAQWFYYLYSNFETFQSYEYYFDEVLGIEGESDLNSITFDGNNEMAYISINTTDSDNVIVFDSILLKGMFIFVYYEDLNFFYTIDDGYCSKLLECPKEYIPIESVETTTIDLDIVDSIENNLRKTWDLSLFSWTHNNIIIQPFSYLCGLFGMSNNSIIAYYLDYWVCISVIYLVFDLVMYVPLLAHKWIDKAKVE